MNEMRKKKKKKKEKKEKDKGGAKRKGCGGLMLRRIKVQKLCEVAMNRIRRCVCVMWMLEEGCRLWDRDLQSRKLHFALFFVVRVCLGA